MFDIFYCFLLLIFSALLITIVKTNPSNPAGKTYSIYVVPSVIDPLFESQVHQIISQSNWNKYYSLNVIVDTNHKINMDYDITISLQNRNYLDQYHTDNPTFYPDGRPIRFSITTQSTTKKPQIFIDATNWKNGIPESKLSLDRYREYVINHELGHGLGFGHMKCISSNCSVMYPATKGCPNFGQCNSNAVLSDLNAPKLTGAYRFETDPKKLNF